MKFVISFLTMATLAPSWGVASSPTLDFNLPDFGSFFHLPMPAPTPPPPPLKEVVDPHALIREAATRHGVPAALVKSIMAAESNFIADVVSPKGAIGLMQLMPETATEFGADPTDPKQNVDAGVQYLHYLLGRYQKHRNGLTRVIAAYNAGPGMVDRYHGIPPFRETRRYVARVLGFLRRFEQEAKAATPLGQRHAQRYEARLIGPE
jgi:soluble lytic murein transglycosylase-like protein